MPRITVKGKQIYEVVIAFLCVPKTVFQNPCGFREWKPGPTEVNGSIVIKFNTTRIGFHLGFRHWEFSMQQGTKAFCSWFMKYILLCQITGLLLVYVNKGRVRSFCWKPPDCCHLIQTKSLSIISNMGFTEWIRAVTIPREEYWYENRCYFAALIKFKSVTADTQKKCECLKEERRSPFFSCTLFLSIHWPPLEIQNMFEHYLVVFITVSCWEQYSPFFLFWLKIRSKRANM